MLQSARSAAPATKASAPSSRPVLRGSPALAGLLLLLLAMPCFAQGDSKPDAKRGEYLSKAGGCLACHTAEAKDDKDKPVPYAGGRALKTPFGTFYGPNI